MDSVVTIRPAAEGEMAIVAMLFREYAASLGVDLSYQRFDAEVAALPGAYAPPAGSLLLAVSSENEPYLRPLTQQERANGRRYESLLGAPPPANPARDTSFPGCRKSPQPGTLVSFGCVAVRPLQENGVCEMKRLYARPGARGKGVGRALAVAAIQAATLAGYRTMRLDTLPGMAAAQALYRDLGFETTPPYYDTPLSGTIFMRKGIVRPGPAI